MAVPGGCIMVIYGPSSTLKTTTPGDITHSTALTIFLSPDPPVIGGVNNISIRLHDTDSNVVLIGQTVDYIIREGVSGSELATGSGITDALGKIYIDYTFTGLIAYEILGTFAGGTS